jgi:hypothetical protein
LDDLSRSGTDTWIVGVNDVEAEGSPGKDKKLGGGGRGILDKEDEGRARTREAWEGKGEVPTELEE